MNSRQRAYLRSLASNIDPFFQIGKNNLTPEGTEAVRECFNNNELVKISVLKNSLEDPKTMAHTIAERTGSEVVEVIGKKIVLYKPFKDDPKIILPR